MCTVDVRKVKSAHPGLAELLVRLASLCEPDHQCPSHMFTSWSHSRTAWLDAVSDLSPNGVLVFDMDEQDQNVG